MKSNAVETFQLYLEYIFSFILIVVSQKIKHPDSTGCFRLVLEVLADAADQVSLPPVEADLGA